MKTWPHNDDGLFQLRLRSLQCQAALFCHSRPWCACGCFWPRGSHSFCSRRTDFAGSPCASIPFSLMTFAVHAMPPCCGFCRIHFGLLMINIGRSGSHPLGFTAFHPEPQVNIPVCRVAFYVNGLGNSLIALLEGCRWSRRTCESCMSQILPTCHVLEIVMVKSAPFRQRSEP